MVARLRSEEGLGLIELLAAMAVLAVALLALAAGFETAAVSLRASAQKTTAAKLANAQLELYRSLPYDAVALDEDAVAALGTAGLPTYDALYAENPVLDGEWVADPVTGVLSQLPSGTVNLVTAAGCGSGPQCAPVQELAGPDGRPYRVETYVRDRGNSTGIRWTERVVTVIVQDAAKPSLPELLRMTTAFDRGP